MSAVVLFAAPIFILNALAVVVPSAHAAVTCRTGLTSTRCTEGRDTYVIREGLVSTSIEKNGRRVATCRRGLVSTRCERR